MFVSTRCLFKDFALTWLSGMNQDRPSPTKLFPKLTPELIKELGLEKGVPSTISAFLLEAQGKKALFDAGLNEKISTGIFDRLKELRISPDEIDYVFITHFHGDHIGGLLDANDNIAFKNAKIYVSKEEYDGWINKMPADKNGLQVKTVKILEKQLIQFDFNDELPLGVIPIQAFGHTPGHTIFRKDDLLIIGDLIHGQSIQFKYPEICATYDHDEEKSIDTRKKILKYAKDNKLMLAGMHLQPSTSSMYSEYYTN
ncbi:Metallo-hydrolase/oxidoreductase [Neocallimastix lanati (nom. inval.)]|jgi:glyoxylase-like metal-dependent hydrolase (beta-lactamase superfamily II)|uniref:Metallo-hydrolase/oxidoreductase n=1 Tax=Neocallimastix californiae TaxID=1754190 RepID=A0A1Y1ZF31_9FUNG|nr:Metallo-hydrolase/oxidoreductase [Neocallimastix sp. JGI-2020a]ORY08882.1 Metallo-hydrolase/oxidoreductase [Neocallimastix californiae]|eukprot:ORY08882.1 Metallo-hydrolase/oxidoreductase [Neocallimastix californiae]